MTIENKFNELIIPGCMVGGAYVAAQVGKDLAWRGVTHLAVAGAVATEIALHSLEDAGFISPLSKQTVIQARYIGNTVAWVFAIWKGPALLSASARKCKQLFGNVPKVLKSPFQVKEYWYNHPNRILLTKQQTAALGATSIVVAALLAGPDRTSWAVDELRATPGLVADYFLSVLNVSKDGWFSSAATPTWAKWATAVPLAASGWWAVNKVATGALWGVNKVFKAAQTPVVCSTYEDLYRTTSRELSNAKETHRDERTTLEKDRATWKQLALRVIDSLGPNVRETLESLTSAISDAKRKEAEEQYQ